MMVLTFRGIHGVELEKTIANRSWITQFEDQTKKYGQIELKIKISMEDDVVDVNQPQGDMWLAWNFIRERTKRKEKRKRKKKVWNSCWRNR